MRTIDEFILGYDNWAKKRSREIVEQYKCKLEAEDIYQDIMVILCQLYQTHKDKNKTYIIQCINNKLSN